MGCEHAVRICEKGKCLVFDVEGVGRGRKHSDVLPNFIYLCISFSFTEKEVEGY